MHRLRSISLRTRLALSFGVVSLTCFAVALVGYSGASTQQTATTVVAESGAALGDIGLFAQIAALNAADLAGHLYVHDGDDVASSAQQLAGTAAELEQLVARFTLARA